MASSACLRKGSDASTPTLVRMPRGSAARTENTPSPRGSQLVGSRSPAFLSPSMLCRSGSSFESCLILGVIMVPLNLVSGSGEQKISG